MDNVVTENTECTEVKPDIIQFDQVNSVETTSNVIELSNSTTTTTEVASPQKFLVQDEDGDSVLPTREMVKIWSAKKKGKKKRRDFYTFNLKKLKEIKKYASNRDRTSDLQIFSLTLSQLSYRGGIWNVPFRIRVCKENRYNCMRCW